MLHIFCYRQFAHKACVTDNPQTFRDMSETWYFGYFTLIMEDKVKWVHVFGQTGHLLLQTHCVRWLSLCWRPIQSSKFVLRPHAILIKMVLLQTCDAWNWGLIVWVCMKPKCVPHKEQTKTRINTVCQHRRFSGKSPVKVTKTNSATQA